MGFPADFDGSADVHGYLQDQHHRKEFEDLLSRVDDKNVCECVIHCYSSSHVTKWLWIISEISKFWLLAIVTLNATDVCKAGADTV